MVDFTGKDVFVTWLKGFPNERRLEAERVLSLRAALRVLPFGLTLFPNDVPGWSRRWVAKNLVLPTLRAISIAIAQTYEPDPLRERTADVAATAAKTVADDLKSSADASARAAGFGAVVASDFDIERANVAKIASNVANAQAHAVNNAVEAARSAAAAANAQIRAIDYAADAVRAAGVARAEAIDLAIAATTDAQVGALDFAVVSRLDARAASAHAEARVAAAVAYAAALSLDATELEKGLTTAALARSPLWPNGVPDWAAKAITEFASTLNGLGEDWDVWPRWYNDWMTGAPWDDALLLRIADDITAGDWGKGPAHVNAMVKRFESEWMSQKPSQAGSMLAGDSLGYSPPRLRPDSIIKTRVAPVLPPALPHLSAAFEIKLNEQNLLAAFPGPLARLALPGSSGAQDKRQRLEALQALLGMLLAAIPARGTARYQVRQEYRDYLQALRRWLPCEERETGNIILADSFARNLRALFAAEAGDISLGFATQLKVILENFQGLRVYYPEVGAHYEDIRTGSLTTPLPIDACEGFIGVIRDFTPSHFDPSVQAAAEASAVPAPPAPPPAAPLPAGSPMPPPDPLGEIDPQKAREKEAGSYFNAVVKGLETIDKAGKAIDGVDKIRQKLTPYWPRIWEWLSRSGGDGPPMPPPSTLV